MACSRVNFTVSFSDVLFRVIFHIHTEQRIKSHFRCLSNSHCGTGNTEAVSVPFTPSHSLPAHEIFAATVNQ
jgi:hypothetical protein